jgi:MarR family transcriptional regulator, 2-MHQ and catechol-resistance regulon repressor
MGTHYRGSEEQVRALNAYIKLMRAAQSVTTRIHRRLAAWKLTPGQLGVLDALYHLGPMSQGDLGRKNLMSNANITLIVDNLEKRSLVERQRQHDDRRFVRVRLTDRGARLFEDAFPHHVANIVEEMGALTPAEQEELGLLCRRLGVKQG